MATTPRQPEPAPHFRDVKQLHQLLAKRKPGTEVDQDHAVLLALSAILTNQHAIMHKLAIIDVEERLEMVDDTELKAAVARIQAGETAAATALGDLAAKLQALIANNNIPQAEIDDLTASLNAAQDALDSSIATNNPPAPAGP